MLGDDLCFVVVSCDLDDGCVWHAAPIEAWAHLLYGCLMLSQVFLNLGSGDSKFHDKLSKQGSAIKYADRFNSEMKEVIMEVIMEAMYVEVWDGS